MTYEYDEVLKPRPFCGETGGTYFTLGNRLQCICQDPPTNPDSDQSYEREKAITLWNTRATEDVTNTEKWGSVAPWEKYKSDLVLEVHHVLTEPTCPTAIVRFEMPERAGKDVISRADCNTVEDAINVALAEAFRILSEEENT